MEAVIVDCLRRDLFEPKLIVPDRYNAFPIVFTGREIDKWESEDYLGKVC